MRAMEESGAWLRAAPTAAAEEAGAPAEAEDGEG